MKSCCLCDKVVNIISQYFNVCDMCYAKKKYIKNFGSLHVYNKLYNQIIHFEYQNKTTRDRIGIKD
jgi:hypothetical protein